MPGKKLWGVDLGGTKTECAVLDENMQTVIRKRVPTEAGKGYDQIVANLKSLIDAVANELGEKPEAIGCGSPGVLEPATQLMKNCNTVSMNGRPMLADLEKALNLPVKLANDANCFALAEALMGAGKEHTDAKVIFGIIMGTGVGGGIIVNKQILAGKQGLTGEWGHNVLEENGAHCYCGKRGCVEKVISGPGLETFYHDQSAQVLKLNAIYQKHLHDPDAYVNATIERLLENYGKALSVVVNILDPDLIIIGGGVGNIDLLYTEGYERIRKYVFNNGQLSTTIVKPLLGDSAGVFGAALLWNNEP